MQDATLRLRTIISFRPNGPLKRVSRNPLQKPVWNERGRCDAGMGSGVRASDGSRNA